MSHVAPAPTPIDRLNGADERAAAQMLERCCGSSHWVREMVARRPFADGAELAASAAAVDDTLTRDDWLEAFAHHPRIGDREVLRARVASWESGEQGGVDAADEQLLDDLAEANREYEARFGFLFLICASGLTGRDMLAAMHTRLANGDPATEWRVAADEQRKITQLRLTRMLEETTPT